MPSSPASASYPEYALWAEEIAALDAVLAGLTDEQWQVVTSFKRWRVFDHVHHLNISDGWAEHAAARPEDFRAERAATPPGSNGPLGRDGPPQITGAQLLERWRSGVATLGEALVGLDPGKRLPWFGPEMSVRAFVAARQMETWSHGQTIHDALGLHRDATDRIRPVCEIGWRTMGWSFAVNALPAPALPVRLELTAPSGELWTWGPQDAEQRVSGQVLDFALTVCQCRNVADTALTIDGEQARQWMAIAQCFAGSAATPPTPGTRVPSIPETT